MKFERQQIRNLQGSVEYTIDVSADGTMALTGRTHGLLSKSDPLVRRNSACK